MARGRQKPNEVKKLHGTFRASEESKNPFVPDRMDGQPEPPGDLDETGRLIWNGTIKELNDKGMLYNIDIPLLKVYCVAYARMEKAHLQLLKDGEVIVEVNTRGETRQVVSPWVTIWNKSFEAASKLALQFGLTPVSRNKIEIPEKPKEDAISLLLKQKKGNA